MTDNDTGRTAQLDQMHAAALESAVVMLAALRIAERALDLEPMPLDDLEVRAKLARDNVVAELYGTDVGEPGNDGPVGSRSELEGEATDAGGRSETDNPLEATGE